MALVEGGVSGDDEVQVGVQEGGVGVKADWHSADKGVREDGDLEGEALGRGRKGMCFTARDASGAEVSG